MKHVRMDKREGKERVGEGERKKKARKEGRTGSLPEWFQTAFNAG